jgi:hypothetical protein
MLAKVHNVEMAIVPLIISIALIASPISRGLAK